MGGNFLGNLGNFPGGGGGGEISWYTGSKIWQGHVRELPVT